MCKWEGKLFKEVVELDSEYYALTVITVLGDFRSIFLF